MDPRPLHVCEGRFAMDPTRHPAVTDPETGLANRLHFDLVFRYFFGAGDRGVALTMLLVTTGGEPSHELGDALREVTRWTDLVAHLGDGHFAVLLLGANLQGGRLAADRVEEALGDGAGPVSLGLATYDPEMEEPDELMENARRALAAAEERGGGVEM